MLMSDIIAQQIMALLDKSEEGTAEIKRNVLADRIGCVPSQINYVIASRFTPEHGYVVESKRGGGGYIRITQIQSDSSTAMMHIINSVGDSIDPSSAKVIIENLVHRDFIDIPSARLIAAAVSDAGYRKIPPELRDMLRADILKKMLMTQI